MKEYSVEIPVHTIFVCMVEAENEEDAKKDALDFFYNDGGRYDKDYYDIREYNAVNEEADIIVEESPYND